MQESSWLFSSFSDATWVWVGVTGIITGYCRHLVVSNGSHVRVRRTNDRIHWGWVADIVISTVAAYLNVAALFLAGPLSTVQGLWAASLGGFAGPALLVRLMKQGWLHEVRPAAKTSGGDMTWAREGK